MSKTETEQKSEMMTQTVRIRLPITRELSEDVFVGINGNTWQIKRGVYVDVPLAVAKVLERSEKMQQVALEFEAQAAAPLEQLEKQ